MIKEVEDIQVESKIEAPLDRKDFIERNIRVPVPGAMDKGLREGVGSVGAGSEGLGFAAGFQAAARDDYVVGVVVAGSGESVDRLLVWSVVAWKSIDALESSARACLHAIGGCALAAAGIGRRGDVSVEPQVFGIADTTAAVRDGCLVFGETNWARRSPVRTCGAKI